MIRIIVNNTLYSHIEKTRVAIYGAGDAGQQVVVALNLSRDYLPVCFVDDNQSLHGLTVAGLKVYSPEDIVELKNKHKFDEILLAMPTIAKNDKNQIIKKIEPLGVKVQEVPSLNEWVDGKVNIADIKAVDIIDLLGREPVPPNLELLSKNIYYKAVMVTGAGGSIGSELCRQIIKQRPKILILYEMSEFLLYSIEKELHSFLEDHSQKTKHSDINSNGPIQIVAILGSVTQQQKQYHIMKKYGVQTVYHAAAYKHVPLVEANPLAGLHNNSVGTAQSLNAAVRAEVETFVLISTDKAVRPTNVMGASKRLAELYCQAIATQQAQNDFQNKTTISIVRFGNVLGSSGSVVPLFKQQIAQGGPITVTHPEVTRFFMTIPEAALLVIQAGAMGVGGDVFLLDMGEPVKIHDLALQMIALSGLKLKKHANDQGDIEICYTGLRAGEKLYEELLIDKNQVQPTQHSRIVKSFEKQFDLSQITAVLDKIEHTFQQQSVYSDVRTNDLQWIIEQLEYLVDGYTSSDALKMLMARG